MSTNGLYILLLCLLGDQISCATVKSFPDRFRAVEILQDEPATIQCRTDSQPFMEFGIAQMLEAYSYDEAKQKCRISVALCSNLLPTRVAPDLDYDVQDRVQTEPTKIESLFMSCTNNKTCMHPVVRQPGSESERRKMRIRDATTAGGDLSMLR
ncbi:uncharacterized protein LOC129590715 [Paramacrobiotus metropolitanus]|uniref:uncharacterized protein LOC129590715 n=1 Tax=Paramacrobiotus metropolitanus TaxID=2943436 RepID=UPI002445BAC5|nr:uncharacterized protein LOC129590715 [Paramacrobiotus metropolitanus]